MRIVSESQLFDRIATQVQSLHRRGRAIHAVEVSNIEFRQLDEDGHIRVNVVDGKDRYAVYIPELRLEVPVRII